MNNQIRMVLKKRYEAEIADAKYKIKCYSDQELIIPEHPDITGEVDKLLAVIGSAEDKLAVMSLHYGDNKAKDILQRSKKFEKKNIFFVQKKCTFCTFGLEVLILLTLGWTDHGTNYVFEYRLFCTIRCPTRASLSLL